HHDEDGQRRDRQQEAQAVADRVGDLLAQRLRAFLEDDGGGSGGHDGIVPALRPGLMTLGQSPCPWPQGRVATRLISVSSRTLGGLMRSTRSTRPRSSRLHQRNGYDTCESGTTKPAARTSARYSGAVFCTSIGWRNSSRMITEWM